MEHNSAFVQLRSSRTVKSPLVLVLILILLVVLVLVLVLVRVLLLLLLLLVVVVVVDVFGRLGKAKNQSIYNSFWLGPSQNIDIYAVFSILQDELFSCQRPKA